MLFETKNEDKLLFSMYNWIDNPTNFLANNVI